MSTCACVYVSEEEEEGREHLFIPKFYFFGKDTLWLGLSPWASL